MKKIISYLLLITILFSTNFLSSFAQKNKDNESITILNNLEIDTNNIKILDINDVFLPKEIEKINKLHEDEESQGFKLKNIIVYEKENKIKLSNGSRKYKTVNVVRQYVGDTKTLNNKKRGMSYWLDVIFNLTIGSYTKYGWKVATVLGINPSNYYDTYQQGDSLRSTIQKVYRDTHYKFSYLMDNGNYSNYIDAMITSRLKINNYLDLYTITKSNTPIRKTGTDYATFYTENYFDDDWIDYIIDIQGDKAENGFPQPAYEDQFK